MHALANMPWLNQGFLKWTRRLNTGDAHPTALNVVFGNCENSETVFCR